MPSSEAPDSKPRAPGWIHQLDATRRSDCLEAGPRFLAIQLGGLGVNSGVLWFSVDYMRWAYLPAQLSVMAMLAFLSYLGQKLWSF